MGKHTLDNDKAFAAYVLCLLGGVCSLWGILTFAGFPTMPPLSAVVEHLGLGLGFRAAYKWVGGWNRADWSIAGESAAEAIATADLHVPAGAAMQGAD